jgi:hypothetical protein
VRKLLLVLANKNGRQETGTVRKDGPFQDHNIVFPSGRKQNCEKRIRETTLVRAPANQKMK